MVLITSVFDHTDHVSTERPRQLFLWRLKQSKLEDNSSPPSSTKFVYVEIISTAAYFQDVLL
jgi:hypothetical protein